MSRWPCAGVTVLVAASTRQNPQDCAIVEMKTIEFLGGHMDILRNSIILLSLLTLSSTSLAAVDVARGRALYKTFCVDCHDSQIHIQKHSKVMNFPQLKKTVRSRALDFSKLSWSNEEITDVAYYLNEQYYHYKITD